MNLLPLKQCVARKGIFMPVYNWDDLFIPGGKSGLEISRVRGPGDVVKSEI